MSEMYSTLEQVVTPVIQVNVTKADGATFDGDVIYLDADDELKEIAKYIKMNSTHNADVNPGRIKFFYTTETKKDAGKFVAGQLLVRNGIEKMINDDYDYIVLVHYKGWKELDMEHKVMQLDKILCGVKITSDDKVKKQSIDSKEYISNLRHFGSDKVLQSTEIVDMAIERIVEEEKEQKRQNG